MTDDDLRRALEQLESAMQRAQQVELASEDEALIAKVLAHNHPQSGPSAKHASRERHVWWITGAVAAGAALVAGTATWAWTSHGRHTISSSASAIALPPTGTSETQQPAPHAAKGDSTKRGTAIEEDGPDGEAIKASGPAIDGVCVRLSPAVTTCADSGSTIEVASPPPHLRVKVTRGRVIARLDRKTRGESFALVTREGEMVATGTTLGVDVSAVDVTYRVLEGTVTVRSSNRRVELRGPAAVRGTDLQRADYSPEEQLLDVTVLSRPLQPTEPTTTSLVEHNSSGTLPVKTPGELLTEARSARANGDQVAAVEKYRELLRVHPQSAESVVARISLADLLLARGDFLGALSSYNAYLHSGGPLAPEAHYGRIRALRALSRTGEERREIESFLAVHPKSAYAATLRGRLRAIGGTQEPSK